MAEIILSIQKEKINFVDSYTYCSLDREMNRAEEVILKNGFILVKKGFLNRNDLIIQMCKSKIITHREIGNIFYISGGRVAQIYAKSKKKLTR